MDEIVHEPVAVRVGTSGQPAHVAWHGRAYQVVGRPVRWIDRQPWWAWTGEQPPRIVEQTMWTVHLAAPGVFGEQKILEADLLAIDAHAWRLERIRR